ncbi:MAG: peptidyl-prolyl cis-trans isomerase [Blastocatellia bacterium]|jgi:parvulin-like peptidyl-prolyl isomerase
MTRGKRAGVKRTEATGARALSGWALRILPCRSSRGKARLPFPLLAFVGLLGWVGATGCQRFSKDAAKDDPTPVIVEINGQAFHASAFDRFIKARLSDFESSPLDQDQQRSSLLDRFILRQLIVRQALDSNFELSEEDVRQNFETQYKQATTEGADQNPAVLQSSERRTEILNDLLELKFSETQLPKEVAVTEEEIKAHYEANRDQYPSRYGFYVREIRVEEEAEARRLQRQSIARPDDFPVLAREHSNAPTAAQGGLIYYETEQIPPPLEQAIVALKVGSVSNVVKSNFGYHLFKLEQRVEPLPFEKIRQEVIERLQSEKKRQLIEAFGDRLAAAASIVIHRGRLGFTYRGRYPAS